MELKWLMTSGYKVSILNCLPELYLTFRHVPSMDAALDTLHPRSILSIVPSEIVYSSITGNYTLFGFRQSQLYFPNVFYYYYYIPTTCFGP
jgi:hypothetical protein